jgi:superfamily I DNA/RNA helicase
LPGGVTGGRRCAVQNEVWAALERAELAARERTLAAAAEAEAILAAARAEAAGAVARTERDVGEAASAWRATLLAAATAEAAAIDAELPERGRLDGPDAEALVERIVEAVLAEAPGA